MRLIYLATGLGLIYLAAGLGLIFVASHLGRSSSRMALFLSERCLRHPLDLFRSNRLRILSMIFFFPGQVHTQTQSNSLAN